MSTHNICLHGELTRHSFFECILPTIALSLCKRFNLVTSAIYFKLSASLKHKLQFSS